MGKSGCGWRPTALTIPIVIVLSRPSGLPTASTTCPWRGPLASLVEWDGRQPGGLYLQERNVCFAICAHNHRIQHLPFSYRFAICAHNHGIQHLPFSRGRRSISRVVRFRRQHHADATRIPYHVLIGDDVSRGIDDDARADHPARLQGSRHLHRWLKPKRTRPKPAPARQPALRSRPIAPARR